MRLPISYLLLSSILWGSSAVAAMNMFRSDEDNPISIESSRSLKVDQANQVVTALGRPKVTRGDITVEAEIMNAFFEEKDDQLSIWRINAQGDLLINAPQASIRGAKGLYDAARSLIIIEASEEFPLHIISEDGEVTADGQIEYYDLEQKIIARDNVVAITKDGQIKAEIIELLLSDTTETTENQQTEQGEEVSMQDNVDVIKAFGNVEMIRGDDIVLAQRALWDRKSQRIILLDAVEVRQKNTKNILRGCRAELDLQRNITLLDNEGCEDNGPITGSVRPDDFNGLGEE